MPFFTVAVLAYIEINESLLRIFLGTLVFLCVAISLSGLATELQYYLHGIFANHQPDFRRLELGF